MPNWFHPKSSQRISGQGELILIACIIMPISSCFLILEQTPFLPPDRYFFRLLLLSKEGHINLDDDDDEELLWETNDAEKADKDDAKGAGCPDNNNAAANDQLSTAKLHSKIASLETENMRLKGQVKTLAGRVTELEKELTRQEQTHVPSSTTSVPPKISATGNNSKVEIKEQSQPTDGTSLKTTGGSTNDSADQSAVAVAPDRSVRRSVLLEPLAVPHASSTSPFAADCANSPFKPITSSGSTSVTLMGTRQSVVSNSATTLATESSINTGSVSPLTEVTEAFIRRAQRASQTATLSNINTSANVSICTSEQEQSSSYMNNNDFQSETASEDSGVLVVPEKGSTGAVKGVTESVSMEMSPLNANTADNLVSEGVVPSAAVENIATEGPGSIKVDTKSPAQLAALDGDEEEDDGWS